MDWKALLEPAPTRAASVASIDRRIADARGRFCLRVAAVGRIGPEAPPSRFAAGFVSAIRRWTTPAPGALERLEQHVEDAQRQVSRIAAEIDALSAEEDGIRAEITAVRDWVVTIAADQASAEDRAEALRRALVDVDLARARASPTVGAALEADRAVLTGHLLRCEAEIRAHEQAAVRASAVVAFGTDALQLCERLRASLEDVHRKGTSLLHALDTSLGQLAAEARAGDLSRSIAAGIEPLRGSVGRVHLQAREGADLLMFRLDALTETSDLLAPADPDRLAAEAEVASVVTKRRE